MQGLGIAVPDHQVEVSENGEEMELSQGFPGTHLCVYIYIQSFMGNASRCGKNAKVVHRFLFSASFCFRVILNQPGFCFSLRFVSLTQPDKVGN